MIPANWPSAPEKFLLPGPVGALECVASGGSPAARQMAVICHPHSLHGGTMDNKVVTMVERCLRDLGAATLRFNFRGVGASAGQFDDGQGEGDDLAAVVELARAWAPTLPLWLAGFSFGSYVSARMATELDASVLISVAPPVARFGFRQVARPACPWLVLQGDADEVVDPAEVFAYFEAMSPPVDMLRFAGAGHFFHGRLVELRSRLGAAMAAHQ